MDDTKVVLRDKIKAHLLAQIQKGLLKVGHTINLAALARVLKVSVTPIREALSQLEESGIVKPYPIEALLFLNYH